jgi:ketosteroid isomerase-like protein
MTGEHHQLIGRIYAACNRGDVDGVVDCCKADAEVRPLLSDLAGSVYRGHDGIRRRSLLGIARSVDRAAELLLLGA